MEKLSAGERTRRNREVLLAAKRIRESIALLDSVPGQQGLQPPAHARHQPGFKATDWGKGQLRK